MQNLLNLINCDRQVPPFAGRLTQDLAGEGRQTFRQDIGEALAARLGLVTGRGHFQDDHILFGGRIALEKQLVGIKRGLGISNLEMIGVKVRVQWWFPELNQYEQQELERVFYSQGLLDRIRYKATVCTASC